MFTLDQFPDAAPRYPDRVAVHAPRGTRAALRRVAEAERVTVPELLRQIIGRAIDSASPATHHPRGV